MGRIYNHLKDRENVNWTSIGKFGHGPIRATLIKDLSDEHLMKIVGFIDRNPKSYTVSLLHFIEDEVIYRNEMNIHIDEYYGLDDPETDPDDDEDDPFWTDEERITLDFPNRPPRVVSRFG